MISSSKVARRRIGDTNKLVVNSNYSKKRKGEWKKLKNLIVPNLDPQIHPNDFLFPKISRDANQTSLYQILSCLALCIFRMGLVFN